MSDDAAFRHSRDRHLGVSISNEFYQPVPMFFTREGASMPLIGHYRGGSAFLLCNGPSMAKLDLTQLNKPGIMTFGMNNGAKTFRPNFWTCVDDPKRFLKSIWITCQLKGITFGLLDQDPSLYQYPQFGFFSSTRIFTFHIGISTSFTICLHSLGEKKSPFPAFLDISRIRP